MWSTRSSISIRSISESVPRTASTGERVVREGAAQAEVLRVVVQPGAEQHARRREPIGDRLPDQDDVGFDPEGRMEEAAPRPVEPGEDLVADDEGAAAPAQPLQLAVEVDRRRVPAAPALHRLDEHGCGLRTMQRSSSSRTISCSERSGRKGAGGRSRRGGDLGRLP